MSVNGCESLHGEKCNKRERGSEKNREKNEMEIGTMLDSRETPFAAVARFLSEWKGEKGERALEAFLFH